MTTPRVDFTGICFRCGQRITHRVLPINPSPAGRWVHNQNGKVTHVASPWPYTVERQHPAG